MRVTGGNLGGRSIRVPRSDVRPTQDRVREAVFSSLQAVVPDVRFLDLFAGSGAKAGGLGGHQAARKLKGHLYALRFIFSHFRPCSKTI